MEFKEDLQLLPKSLGMTDLRLSLSKSRSMLWEAQNPWRSHLGWFKGPCWLPAYSQHQPTAIQVTCLGHWERLSLTEVYSGSSESSSRSRILVSSSSDLHNPGLARIRQSQFGRILLPLPRYLIMLLIPHSCYLITLLCPQKESCLVSSVRIFSNPDVFSQ